MGEGAPQPSSSSPDDATTVQVQLPEARGKRPARSPAVLVVGDGEPLGEALLDCMKRRGLVVATSPTERAIASAVARAPDLVILVGDAAREGGQRTIRMLATRPTTARLPVVVLEDAAGDALDRRLRALRAGALAIVDRSASADAMAGRVADLAIFVADHGKRTAAGIDVTLDELASVVRKELGQLLPDDDASGATVEAPGREMAEAIERFVASVRAMVRRSDPDGARLRGAPAVRSQADELGAADLAAFDDGATHALRGARILVVVDDAGRGDSLATELRARGATVVVSGPRAAGLARGRELDPEVVLVDADAVGRDKFGVAAWLAQDPRLRWSAVLVTKWEELAPRGATVPGMPAVAERIGPCRALERDLAARAHEEARLDVDIASIGPCRALRALASVPHVLSVTTLEDPGGLVIDVANGLVAGATQRDGSAGLAALAHFLALPACTLHVERRRAPQSANVLLPVEDALALAGRELVAGLPADDDVPAPSLPVAPDGDDEPVTIPGTRAAPRAPGALDFLDDSHDTATDVSPVRARAPARAPVRGAHAPAPPARDPAPAARAMPRPGPVPQSPAALAARAGKGAPASPARAPAAPVAPPPALSLTPGALTPGALADALEPELAGASPRPQSPARPGTRTLMGGLGPPPLPAPPVQARPRTLPGVAPPYASLSEPPGPAALSGDDALSVPPDPLADIAPPPETSSTGSGASAGNRPPEVGPVGTERSGSGATALPFSPPVAPAFPSSGSGATSFPQSGSGAAALPSPGSGAAPFPQSGSGAAPFPQSASGAAPFPQSGSGALPFPSSAPPSASSVPPASGASGTFAAPPGLGAGAAALGAPPAHAMRATSRGPSSLVLGAGALVMVALVGAAALAVWHFVLAAPPTAPIASIPLAPHLVLHPPPPPPTAPLLRPTPPAAPVVVPPTPVVDVPTPPTQTPTPPRPTPTPVQVAPVPTPPVPVPAVPPPPPTPTVVEVPSALDAPLPELEQSEALTEQARALLDHHDDAGAEPLLLQAAALGPRNPHPMEALARLYLARGDGPHAVEWAEKLVGVRHRRAAFRVLLGDARKLAGDQAGAESAWRDALGIEPDNHDAHARLGE